MPLMRFAPLLLALSACGMPSSGEESNPRASEPRPADKPLPTSIDFYDYADMEKYNGQTVTVKGTFNHYKWSHGQLKLEGGLVLILPHFDLFKRGDDWHKYLGQDCTATGVLHAYTKDIDGYRGPTLQVESFYGSGE